uniref:Uncharacterized protein n=1 Tax=Caenorhabditis tropicalis TaxID=1561998 RepID=A0A1I7T3E7_9PELO
MVSREKKQESFEITYFLFTLKLQIEIQDYSTKKANVFKLNGTQKTVTPINVTIVTTIEPTTVLPIEKISEANEPSSPSSSSSGNILLLLFFGGFLMFCIVGAFFGYKWYMKKPEVKPRQRKDSKNGGKRNKSKPKQKKTNEEEEGSSEREYEEKKQFSGVIVNV